MPTYVYKCGQGHVCEIVQSMKDDALTQCTKCEEPAKRVPQRVGFALKGNGWSDMGYSKDPRDSEDGTDKLIGH